jgi:hypothetical protein
MAAGEYEDMPDYFIKTVTAGVTGQQGMLTPSWYLIPPLIY